MGEKSAATRFLDRRPEVRAAAAASPDFQAHKASLRAVDIDGTTFYVVGGDQLRDEDEIALDWARENGLVQQIEVDRFHDEGRH